MVVYGRIALRRYLVNKWSNEIKTIEKGDKQMGYILILLVFLIWRNTVCIRKAVYYTAYGNEYKKGIIRRMFVALANIRREEKEEKKQKKAKKAEVQTDEIIKD